MDKKLACSGSEFNTDNIIFYDKKVPYLEILKILRKYEEKQVTEDVERLTNIDIALNGSVINLDELARMHNVSPDALKAVMKQNKNDYLLVGNQLIANQTLKVIQRELDEVKKYSEALVIIGNYGIKGQQIFDLLGYKVKWNGLDPEDAEIVKLS